MGRPGGAAARAPAATAARDDGPATGCTLGSGSSTCSLTPRAGAHPHLRLDGAGHDVARRQLSALVVARHEALAAEVAQQAALAAHRLQGAGSTGGGEGRRQAGVLRGPEVAPAGSRTRDPAAAAAAAAAGTRGAGQTPARQRRPRAHLCDEEGAAGGGGARGRRLGVAGAGGGVEGGGVELHKLHVGHRCLGAAGREGAWVRGGRMVRSGLGMWRTSGGPPA